MNKSYVVLVLMLHAVSLQSFSYGNYGSKDSSAEKKKAMAIARANEHQRQARLREKQKREQEMIEERKKAEQVK